MSRSVFTVLIVVALLAYPFTMYFAADRVAPKILLAGVLTLLALRVLFRAWRKSRHPWRWLGFAAVLLLAAVATLFSHGLSLEHVRLYPVAVDSVFFLVFFISLFTSRPLVERIARASGAELGPDAILYTRRVTWAWSGVLLVNTLIALYTTLYASMAVWTLYNGLLSYFLIGAVFLVEYLIRRRVRRIRLQP
ncbi:MAG: hypothetical protein WBR15_04000 [Gammaproteobacteria bacterium]